MKEKSFIQVIIEILEEAPYVFMGIDKPQEKPDDKETTKSNARF